jgi:site-specific DNA-methyltransferase (adenine-specific)
MIDNEHIETGTIHCGDCLEIMRQWPSACIGCCVTSPPYNLLNSTGNGMKYGRGGKWSSAALRGGYGEYGDCLPEAEYNKWQRDCLTEMLRLLKPDGAIFYNHKWRVQGGLLQDRHEIIQGFPVRQIIIWQRAGGFNFNDGYFVPTYEVIYLICKPDFKLQPKANALGDVWRIPQETGNPHPAPFPVQLATNCIISGCPEGGIVLDPFMGSGTTAVAANLLDRRWVGIELNEEYVKMARNRTKQTGLFCQ